MPTKESAGNMSKAEPGNILIVDDDTNHLYIYEKLVAAPGRRIYTAPSGEEALKILLKEEEISLILMDVKMPGMSGFDTLPLIRQRKKLRDLPIIFISGVDQTGEFMRSGFQLGAYDYILSPPNEEYLKNKVNVFLTLYQQKRELSRKTEELARQKAQLEAILTTVPTILFVLDKEDIATSVNQAFQHIQARYPKISSRHFVEAVEVEIKTCLQTGNPISKQLMLAREEQTPLIFDSVLSPLHIDREKPEILLTITDVTESQLAADLRTTLKELRRSNQELEQFAYSVSHDLNEPLRTVDGFVRLLSKRSAGKMDAKADEFMRLICEGTERMKKMIKDILDYSRIRTRGNPLAPVNTGKVMDIVTANLSRAMAESRAQIIYSDLPAVLADEFQLVKLFQNLVGNALKFRGKKKPRILIEAQALVREGKWKTKTEVEITEKYTTPLHHGPPPPMWLFSVRDNGIGIDIQSQEKIFDIFKRVHRDEKYPGTGIGLAISKKIVERHGGIIWVESQPDEGSTFYFTIPRQAGD